MVWLLRRARWRIEHFSLVELRLVEHHRGGSGGRGVVLLHHIMTIHRSYNLMLLLVLLLFECELMVVLPVVGW